MEGVCVRWQYAILVTIIGLSTYGLPSTPCGLAPIKNRTRMTASPLFQSAEYTQRRAKWTSAVDRVLRRSRPQSCCMCGRRRCKWFRDCFVNIADYGVIMS